MNQANHGNVVGENRTEFNGSWWFKQERWALLTLFEWTLSLEKKHWIRSDQKLGALKICRKRTVNKEDYEKGLSGKTARRNQRNQPYQSEKENQGLSSSNSHWNPRMREDAEAIAPQ